MGQKQTFKKLCELIRDNPNIKHAKMLTLSRYDFLPYGECAKIAKDVGVNFEIDSNVADDKYPVDTFILEALGFKDVQTIDVSSYESASMVWDLNYPVPTKWHNQFDLIFEAGTFEHVFNLPQVLKNVFLMLRPARGGGILL